MKFTKILCTLALLTSGASVAFSATLSGVFEEDTKVYSATNSANNTPAKSAYVLQGSSADTFFTETDATGNTKASSINDSNGDGISERDISKYAASVFLVVYNGVPDAANGVGKKSVAALTRAYASNGIKKSCYIDLLLTGASDINSSALTYALANPDAYGNTFGAEGSLKPKNCRFAVCTFLCPLYTGVGNYNMKSSSVVLKSSLRYFNSSSLTGSTAATAAFSQSVLDYLNSLTL